MIAERLSKAAKRDFTCTRFEDDARRPHTATHASRNPCRSTLANSARSRTMVPRPSRHQLTIAARPDATFGSSRHRIVKGESVEHYPVARGSDEDLTAGTNKRIEDHRRCFSGGNKRKAAFEKPPVGTRTHERTTEGFTPPPTIMKEARGRERFVWSGRWDLNHTPSPGRP